MRRVLTAILSLALLATAPAVANASDQVDVQMRNVDGVLVDSSIPVDSRAELEKFVAESGVPLDGVLDADTGYFVEVRRRVAPSAPVSGTMFVPTAVTQHNPCPSNSFCLVPASSVATSYGFTGSGGAYGTWNGRKGVKTGNNYSGFFDWLQGPGDVRRSPTVGKNSSWNIEGGNPFTVTYVNVYQV